MSALMAPVPGADASGDGSGADRVVMVIVVALSLLAARLAGGRLRALLELRLRAVALLWAALALQVGLLAVPGPPTGWRAGVYMASYPLALAFAWANRHLTGVVVAAAGATLNLVAIVANGGMMPASQAALDTAGLAVEPGVWTNSTSLADPRLQLLGDVFAVPRGWPLATVFSLGDVIIVIGAVVAVQAITCSRLVPGRWRVRTA